MSISQSAPHITDALAVEVREARRSRGNHYTSHVVAGRFTTLGGAVVEVRALLRFGTEQYPGKARVVEGGASAKCLGHGCFDPGHEQFIGAFLLDDDADKTTEATLPLVQAASEWAQKHAETCRAMPYDGR